MIAAIYARKSTEQVGVDDDAKSVDTQTANARAFIKAKRWRVSERHVYGDDAVSGAETAKLVSKAQLLAAIADGTPPFQVLVMRDASRLSRRDGDEAFGELKKIAQAGVEIWFYKDGSRFTYGSFGDNIVGFVRAEMNAEYRRQISVDTKESHIRKFKAGHVVGGACFGYDNVRVGGHTDRRINPAAAAVVRRIFRMSAGGAGYSRIAKDLNADGAPTPTRGTPWAPTTVLAVLKRPLYRGEVVWNKTRRRAADGTATYARRPESEWLRIERPDLRIVDDVTWHRVRARLDGVRARLQAAARPDRPWGRRRRQRDVDSKYLLSGYARCAVCGGCIGVIDSRLYACYANYKRGATVCRNTLKMPIARLDAAVLRTLGTDVLRPAVVQATLAGILAALNPKRTTLDLTHSRRTLATVEREIANLTRAIAAGGQLPPLLEALTARHAQRTHLTATVAAQTAVAGVRRLDRGAVTRKTEQAARDWRTKLAGRLAVQRELLREILEGPIRFTPDGGTYVFEGDARLGTLLTGAIGLSDHLMWRARQGSNLQPLAPED